MTFAFRFLDVLAPYVAADGVVPSPHPHMRPLLLLNTCAGGGAGLPHGATNHDRNGSTLVVFTAVKLEADARLLFFVMLLRAT